MAEGGHDPPRPPYINSSSESTNAKGRTVSRSITEKMKIFEDKQHMIHSGRRGGRQPSDCVTKHGAENSHHKQSPERQAQIMKTDLPKHNSGHAALAEGDHVIQDFRNSIVNVVAGDQYTTVINETHVAHPSGRYENKLNQDQMHVGADKSFLVKTKQHLRNEVGEIDMPARPTTMVIDMQTANDASFRDAGHSDSETVFGRDVEPISLVQFHDPVKGKAPRHVMILGEAGAGKSTTSGMYCLAIADGKVNTLRSVKLVHYVQAARLHNLSTANAFDVIFTEQMANNSMTELSVTERAAGASWLNENSEKLLLVIDGLDQCLNNFVAYNPPISVQQNDTRVNEIIARVMGGNIWRGARILTTSRWNIYWNLTAEQKPDKVIGLRGLDDENLRLAASGQSPDGDKMIDQLLNTNTSQKLLNLCRNPMFLKYATKIFETNFENLPDSISDLMSAFFRNFFRLSPEKYDDITRLAYNGMLDNVFVFSRRYLDNLGIIPNDLKDFLSAAANPEKDQETANTFDDVFAFAHQTMQEFCCALHIPSLEQSEMKKFLTNHLYQSGMELTGQLLYGLILNDKVTNPMRKYLTVHKSSIQECREVMLEQLLGMVKDGSIREIQTVRLLSECGDDIIQKIEERVQRFIITTRDLLYSDQLLLALLIKRLSPLATVFVWQFTLDPSMISYVKDCLVDVDLFEAGFDVMDSVMEIHFADVMTILNRSKLWYVRLRCNDDVKLLFLSNWIERPQIHLTNLGLLNITRVETVTIMLKFLSKHSMTNLRLHINSCIIGPEFTNTVTRHGSITKKVNSVTIEDKAMTFEKIEAYLDICRQCQFKGLGLSKCDLTDNDVRMILNCCRSHAIKLSELSIWDGLMTPDVYCDVVEIINITGCSTVFFGDCDLTKQKLECFAAAGIKNYTSLSRLKIADAKMPAYCYREIAITLNAIACKEVHFENCDLTKRKLTEFIFGCKDNELSLAQLSLWDGTMTSDIYGNVADIISITGCSTIFFGECDLTKQKLQSFTETGKNNKISLSKLHVSDVKMPAEGYREIATTLKSISCKEIVFGHCELTSLKLFEFYTGCKDNDLSLSTLYIIDAKMPAETFREIAITLKTTCCKEIHFETCELTTRKLSEFFIGCKDNQLSLSRLNILDSTMLPDAYYEVGNIVKITKCAILHFRYCDLSIQKLESLGKGCKESHSLIPTLGIDWSNITATDDHISILCDLMTVVGEILALFNLEIDDKRKQRLIDALHLENSKIQRIQFPDGSIHEKRVSARS